MSDSQTRREDARVEVLRFLANRHRLKHSVDAVRRGVNREGFDFSPQEIDSALLFRVGLGQVTAEPVEFGATLFYQATSQGVLAYERGQ